MVIKKIKLFCRIVFDIFYMNLNIFMFVFDIFQHYSQN